MIPDEDGRLTFTQYAGFLNEKVSYGDGSENGGHKLTQTAEPQAVGIQPKQGGGVTMITKKTKHHNRPTANKNEVAWGSNKSGPK